ncbi:MAG: phosphoribosylglycinamide formyltransferase [Candidatus Eisenbacteria bacterium]|nr:phosphoribosylglycinamide formyltransferase [Candidatus Eisenbacteria bacterium]
MAQEKALLKCGVLASGRGTNLEAILKAQKRGVLGAEVAVVLSDVQTAGALEKAKEYGIPSFFVSPGTQKARLPAETEMEYTRILKSFDVGLVLLAGFMRILGKTFLENFRNRILNIHPSLLPSFRGLEAQRQALEYGVKYAGCTVHFVDEGVDSGPIILQAVVPVYDNDTAHSLSERILAEEHRIYPEAVRLFAQGRLEVSGRRVVVRPEE